MESRDLRDSGVNGSLLSACTLSAYATADLQTCLQPDNHGSGRISFSRIPTEFTMQHLYRNCNPDQCRSAWRSLLIYSGALTFDAEAPSEKLTITNLIVRTRFGRDLIPRLGLEGCLVDLARNGEILTLLWAFQKAMVNTFCSEEDFQWTKADYRDTLCETLLQNPGIDVKIGFRVSHLERPAEESKSPGPQYVDILIESATHCILLELRNIQLPYLKLNRTTLQGRAEEVQNLCRKEVLAAEFSELEIHCKGTIEGWVSGEVLPQLVQHANSKEIQQRLGPKKSKMLRAYVVTFIGSQKILFGEIDGDSWECPGLQLAEPYLVSRMFRGAWTFCD